MFQNLLRAVASSWRGLNCLVEGRVRAFVGERDNLALWMIVLGFAMCVFAVTIKIDFVVFEGRLFTGFDAAPGTIVRKEVGFLWSGNWSVFCTVITPCIVWFGLNTLDATDATLEKLCDAKMLRNGEFEPIPYATIQRAWDAHLKRLKPLFTLVFLLVVYYIMSDWWTVVGEPILYPNTVKAPISDPVMEYDWSVAYLFANSKVAQIPLLIFGFVAYAIYAALVPALVISVTFCAMSFMWFLTTVQIDGENIQFVVAPDQPDHFGFKNFSEFFHNYLLMNLAILIGLWLMTVQNVYLRDTTSNGIWSFIIGEVKEVEGFLDQIEKGTWPVLEITGWILKPFEAVMNHQVAFGVLLFAIVLIGSFVGCWIVLHVKAVDAQQCSLRHSERLAAQAGLSKEILEHRLEKEMQIWPVGWIGSKQLFILMILIGGAMITYRTIAVPVLLGAWLGFVGWVKHFLLNGGRLPRFWFLRRRTRGGPTGGNAGPGPAGGEAGPEQ